MSGAGSSSRQFLSSVANNPRSGWLEYLGLPEDLDEWTVEDVRSTAAGLGLSALVGRCAMQFAQHTEPEEYLPLVLSKARADPLNPLSTRMQHLHLLPSLQPPLNRRSLHLRLRHSQHHLHCHLQDCQKVGLKTNGIILVGNMSNR